MVYQRLHAAPADNGRSVGFQTRDGKFHVKAGLYPGTHEYFAATLADLAAGTRAGRICDDEIVIFYSTGTRLQDMAAAYDAIQKKMCL